MEVFSSTFYIDWNKKVRLVDRVRLVVPVPVEILREKNKVFEESDF